MAIQGANCSRNLPPALLQELLNATLDGNKRLLDRLILKVREADCGGSADTLQETRDQYEYDS